MIDILLATYNAGKYLSEFLDSVFNQDFSDFNIIAGDDNSTDGTLSVLEEYSKKYPGKITLYAYKYSKSSSKENFFRLLDYSGGDYIMLADQDDVWKPNKLSVLYKEISNKNNSIPQLIHSDLTVTDENLNIISESMFKTQQLPYDWFLLNNLIVQNNVTGCTVIFNKALKNKIRYKNLNNVVIHDWWFAIVASAFGQISFINSQLVFYRQHDNNSIGAKDVKTLEYFNKRMNNKEDIRKNIRDTYIQSGEFLETYRDELSDLQKEMLEIYSNFSSLSKTKKIKMLNKYMLWKNTFVRRTGQIIWG